MKQSLILVIMFFVSGKLLSQTERYIYQTEVNPDTINLVNMKVENTFLDIKNNESLFISESRLLRDSVTAVLRQQGISEIKRSKKDKSEFPKLPNGKSIQPTFFDYFIVKKMDDKSVNFVENIGSKQVYYPEDRKINWDISQQTAEAGNQKVQRATAKFGGRTWTAWFASDIKIADGPYKFHGLPGLILKLEDDKGDYRFTFIRKIMIEKAFAEIIKPDARKSTRINFLSDKASVRMEMVTNKDPEINLDSFNRMNNGSGRMTNGFGGQKGMNGEMPNGNMASPDIPVGNTASQSSGNIGMMNYGNTNPIELSNRN